MDWALWNELEALLVKAGVKPILAVIPDNQDPKLLVDPPSPAFWDRVRQWQARGWSIGLHGHQHRYVNAEPGILRLNRQSEFAGLGYQEQAEKLQRGLEVFAQEGVRADAWVAPAHSFDWVTVAALSDLGIHTISDGMALSPFRDPLGNIWIPQQFANMRPMPWGVWTFCYHLQDLTPEAMTTFRIRLKQLGPEMISLQEAAGMGNRPRSAADRLVDALRQAISGLRRLAN
jgi:peptidoglycan/xylan/chitin deacetylase (PgdA/CDA1 family)